MKILILDDSDTFNRCLSTDDQSHTFIFDGKYDFKKPYSHFNQFDYVFYRNYFDLLNQLSAARALAAGCRVVFVSDGVFEWANIHRFVGQPTLAPLFATDCFIVDEFAKHFIRFHNPHITGQVLKYLPKNASHQSRDDVTKDYDFLITTANSPYFDDSEFSRLTTLLEQLVSALKISGYSYAFRIFDDALISTLAIKPEQNLKQGTFSDAMCRVGAVLTTPSTIAITAMTAGLPVALLRYRDAPITLSTGWNLFLSADFDTALQAMNDRDEERMQFQAIQVKSLVELGDIDASEALDLLEAGKPSEKIDIERLLDPRYFSIRLLIVKTLKNLFFKSTQKSI